MPGNQKLKSIDVAGERPLQLYVTYRLSTLSAQLNRQAGYVLKRAGNLRVPEWRILAMLSLHGEMNGSAIVDLVGFDPGQISRIFRALEARGLISVRRTDDDRRSAYMSLTRAGRALHAKVLPAMQQRQEHLLAALTPQERATFLRVIDKLQVAAERRDFPAS
jgi:DNA-binding MarR family transcriptional regulator